jgi:predicted O-methyltransferase YrrM
LIVAASVARQVLRDIAAVPKNIVRRLRGYAMMAVEHRLQREIASRFPAKPYLAVMEELHAALRPRAYLEIGVALGDTLRLSRAARSTGVDPAYSIQRDLSGATYRLYRETSDAFFARPDEGVRYDFAFVDGLHLFEQSLRDIVNAERICTPGAVIAVHDVLPSARIMQSRRRLTHSWTGDVWKVIPALRRLDPMLRLTVIDTPPSGLLLVANLNPKRRLDPGALDRIVADLAALAFPGADGLRTLCGADLVPPDDVARLVARPLLPAN